MITGKIHVKYFLINCTGAMTDNHLNIDLRLLEVVLNLVTKGVE